MAVGEGEGEETGKGGKAGWRLTKGRLLHNSDFPTIEVRSRVPKTQTTAKLSCRDFGMRTAEVPRYREYCSFQFLKIRNLARGIS